MVEHHDEMVEAAGGKRIRWAPFCAKAMALGLVDTRGQAPTERNARETWAQARRAVREARAELAARPPKPIYPSRMPKGWVPPAILAAIEAGNPAVEGARTSGAGPDTTTPPAAGMALVARSPPPPVPPPKPEGGRVLSRYANPDDPPEVQEAYASIEEQLNKADWYLMGGTSKQRRRE